MAIKPNEKANFDTLVRACEGGNVCLMETTRKGKSLLDPSGAPVSRAGERVLLVCAINRTQNKANDPGPYLEFVPLGELVVSNPFETYNPPIPEMDKEAK